MSGQVASIIDIIAHTPLWVWALYVFVLTMGFQRTRDRVVPLWRILALPGVLAVLAATGWVGAGIEVLPAIAVGVIVGAVGGWLLEREGATRRLAGGRLWLRGEWWSFLQILVILVFRYVVAVTAAVNPMLNADPNWHQGTVLISSLLTALFLGRAAARLRVYFLLPPPPPEPRVATGRAAVPVPLPARPFALRRS